MRLQERRENKLFDLIEKKLKDSEDRTNERHIANQSAMAILAEADRRQREEHVLILKNQEASDVQHKQISSLLDTLITKLKFNA